MAAENQAEHALGGLLGGEAPHGGTPEPDGQTTPDDGDAEQPTPELLAGKYKTVDDLVQGYTEAQSKLGEQGNELGELRRRLDQLAAQQAPQYQQPPQALDEDTYEDLLDENPQQALAYAQQAGDQYRAVQALKAWYETDPYTATEWRLAQERQNQAAQFQQQFAGYETHLHTQQMHQAVQNVTARYPDLPTVEEDLMRVASENPVLLEPLKTGAPEDRERVIEALYAVALLRRGTGPAPTGATPQEAPHVATASNIPQGRSTPRNPLLERLAQEADEQVLPWNR